MIDFPKLFRALLGQPEPEIKQPAPTKAVQASSQAVFEALMKVVPQTAKVYLSDQIYWLCSKEDIERILAFDKTNKTKYVLELYDCDDYSYHLMGQLSTPTWSGIAFGIIWTDTHAFNIMVDDQLRVWFIEPQSDKIAVTFEAWQGTEVMMIVM